VSSARKGQERGKNSQLVEEGFGEEREAEGIPRRWREGAGGSQGKGQSSAERSAGDDQPKNALARRGGTGSRRRGWKEGSERGRLNK